MTDKKDIPFLRIANQGRRGDEVITNPREQTANESAKDGFSPCGLQSFAMRKTVYRIIINGQMYRHNVTTRRNAL